MVLFAWGEEYLPAQNAKYGVAVDTLAYQMGLRDGDMILSVDNKPIESINKVAYEVLINKAQSIQAERNGQKIDVAVTEDDLSEMIKNKYSLVEARFPLEVLEVLPGKSAVEADIKKGDRIIGVNNMYTPFTQDVTKVLKNNKNLPVEITLLRGKDTVRTKAKVSEDGMIGIGINTDMNKYFQTKSLTYGFFASFPAGIHKAYETFDGYIKQMKVIFTVKDAHKEIGGFMSIGKAYSTTWDWQRFWAFTAFLSIVLAIMNILPIPALDGGHVMFLLYEVITGRKPNEKVMEYAQYAGMFLLLALLLYANGNDVARLFGK
jgi:regulator of sigma E protease